MEWSGEAGLPAPPERVRAALRDRGLLGRLLPAARTLRETADGGLEGELAVGVPPLVQRYPLRLRAGEDGEGLHLEAAGLGRAEGLRLEVRCSLRPGGRPGTTLLRYGLRLELGGLSRLLGAPAASRLVSEFLAGLARELGGP